MSIKGKVIGIAIGVLLLSHWGLIIGLVLGDMYDKGIFSRLFGGVGAFGASSGRAGYSSTQQVFFDTSFAVMGYIAKADGRVSEQEIKIAEQIMAQMNLTGERRARAIEMFSQGKSVNFDCQLWLNKFRRVAWFQPGLVRLFLDIQMEIAMANGAVSPASKQALRQVFRGLGIPDVMFKRYETHFNNAHQRQYSSNEHSSYARMKSSSELSAASAYGLLEVSENASDAEVKKAYRRKMSKHHPDRLIAKGVPPEMVKMATQKTQKIKQAYEQVKSLRNMV
jgi:DnaJ like chaperone protein